VNFAKWICLMSISVVVIPAAAAWHSRSESCCELQSLLCVQSESVRLISWTRAGLARSESIKLNLNFVFLSTAYHAIVMFIYRLNSFILIALIVFRVAEFDCNSCRCIL